MANIYKNCVDCNTDFYITDRAQAFYKEKEYSLPKRCFDCRKKRSTGFTSHRNHTSFVNHARPRLGVNLTNQSEKPERKRKSKTSKRRRRQQADRY